jgi:hypothetical protein
MKATINSLNAERLDFELRETLREDAWRRQRYQLNLPNLRIRQRMRFAQRAPDRLTIAIVVENVGSRAAGTCDALAEISVNGATTQVVVQCPALPAQSWTELALGEFGPAPAGTTVNVTAVIDPQGANRPGGVVWESDETDNLAKDSVFVLAQSLDEPPLGADLAPPKP